MALDETETSTPYADKLTRDKHLKLSNDEFEVKIKELCQPLGRTKIQELEAVAPYPSPYVLALFASKVYENQKKSETDEDFEKRLKLPEGWKLLTTAYSGGWFKFNGYHGAAYYNADHGQIVVAHRGTKLTNIGSLRSDLNGVYEINYVPQMSSACTFIHRVLASINKDHWRVFTTGHSLGGWLAQIATFSLKYLELSNRNFLKNQREGCHAHAVVFDSPGCRDMLLKMALDYDVRYAEKTISSDPLDITTYLSTPNVVNCCNYHVGTIYRLFPKITTENYALYTLKSHSIDGILQTFDPKTGEVEINKDKCQKIERVVDWPKIEIKSVVWQLLDLYLDSSFKDPFFGEEYEEFFKFANTTNDFHPNKQITKLPISDSSKNVVCIRYQTKPYRENECSPSVFTQSELELLQALQWLQKVPEFFKPFELFTDLNGDPLIDEDTKYIMSHLKQISYQDTITSSPKSNLRHLVPFFKTLLRLYPDLTDKAKSALDSFGAREIFYNNISTEYRTKMKPLTLFFKDSDWAELDTFLKKSDTNVCQIFTENHTDIVAARVLKNIASGSFKNQFSMDLHIAISVHNSFYLKEILSSDDVGNTLLVLECKELNEDGICFVNELLNIAKKKKNFKMLIITPQSEKSSEVNTNCKNNLGNKYQFINYGGVVLDQLTEEARRNMISNKVITFQGGSEKINLKQLLTNEKSDIDLTQLSTVLDSATIVKLLKGENILVGKPIEGLGKVSEYYIPRKFLHIPIVGKQNFEQLDKVKVETPKPNESNQYPVNLPMPLPLPIAQFMAPSIQASHIEQLIAQKIELSLDENPQNWKEDLIPATIKTHFSLLLRERNIYDEASLLKKNSSKDKSAKPEDKIIIISDVSGMGKTTILSSLAEKMMFEFPKAWILQINLNECAKSLGEVLANKSLVDEIEPITAVDLLLNKLIKSNKYSDFDKQLLKMGISEYGGVVIFFDSFDEISPKYDDIVTRLLQALVKTKVEKILVTTRPHIKEKLEKILGTFSHYIQSLSYEDQISFLVKFWRYRLGSDLMESEELEKKAKISLDNLKQSVKDPNSVFSGIALHCEMIGEYMLENLDEVNRLSKEISLMDLYQHFVEKKFTIYEKGSVERDDLRTENKNLFVKIHLRKLHWYFALRILLTEEAWSKLTPPDIDQESKSYLKTVALYVGLMVKVDDHFPQFLHRAFAEYFFLEYVLHLAKEPSKNESNLKLLSPILLLNREFQVSRSFFDNLIRDGKFSYEIRNIYKCYVGEEKCVDEPSLALLLGEKKRDIFHSLFQYLKTYCSEETVKSMVKCPASEMNGYTALHIAVLHQDTDIATLLIDNGACVNAKDAFERVPLHHASALNEMKILETLLRNGSNVNARDKKGLTPLHIAADNGKEEIVDFLISEGSNVNSQGEFKETPSPLYYASWNGNHQVVNSLLKNGANVDARFSIDRTTPLHMASCFGHLDAIRTLFKYHCNANPKNQMGFTPVHVASQMGQYEALVLLAEHGSNLTARSDDNSIPLHSAANFGHERIIEYLIEKSDHVNARNKDGLTPLHLASLNGHLNVVHLLISKGGDVNSLNTYGQSPLRVAASSGHQEIVRLLIDNKSKVNARDNDGATPLHVASMNGHLNVVHLLISKGGDVNSLDTNRQSPLIYAAAYGNQEIVRLLINHKSEVNVKDKNGETPLFFAAHSGNLESVRLLVENKGEINVANDDGVTPLHRSSASIHSHILAYLVDNGADIEAREKGGFTPFSTACFRGNLENARYLVKKGSDVNTRNKNGHTPLQIALGSGNKHLCRFLIENGADVNTKYDNGANILHFAVGSGNLESVRILVENKVEINVANDDGVTPLHISSASNHSHILEYLVDNGADIEARDKEGFRPLDVACSLGNLENARYLVKKGSDVNARNKDGHTPLQFAVGLGNEHLCRFLIENGADVNTKYNKGLTSLHHYSFIGSIEMVKFLIRYKADVNCVDLQSNTPLHCAVDGGHLEVVRLLLSSGANDKITNIFNLTPLGLAQILNNTDMIALLSKSIKSN